MHCPKLCTRNLSDNIHIYIYIYIYNYIYLYIYISIREEEQVKKWPFKRFNLPEILVFGTVIAVIVAVFITAVLTL